MSKEISKDEVIKHKKNAIKKINGMFEAFINNPSDRFIKKADLIAYWIETYSGYLLDEEQFDYTRLPSYKRGDVVLVNFGFNVGSEQGGLHYAIVLDNENKHKSRVVTVIPLSSVNGNDTHERDVFLGNELYDKLNSKYERLVAQKRKELQEEAGLLELIKGSKLSVMDGEESENNIENLIKMLEERVEKFNNEMSVLEGYKKRIVKLKKGSKALVEQVTTISKMRIYAPKNSMDLLHGIKFSDGAMDKINEKFKELYVFGK